MTQHSSYSVVFPGQGSQSVGMLSDHVTAYPQMKRRFEEASEVLGYDLFELSQQGPAEKLNQTEVTQPLMLTADIALWDLLQEQLTHPPRFLAGHSLGEYAALVAAGVMSFAQAVATVEVRAKAMAAALPEGSGGMLAVLSLDREQLDEICQQVAAETGLTVSCVNYNAPGQTVIGGHVAALDQVKTRAMAEGARRVVPVAMSVPSHSPLMQPAAKQLEDYLEGVDLQSPSVPVINNAWCSQVTSPQQIKQSLVEQVYHPVNWIQLIEQIVAESNDPADHILVECGPGKVLTGLNKRIAPQAPLLSTGALTAFDQALSQLKSIS